MKELDFEPKLCRVCQEHMVCESQSEEMVEEVVEFLEANYLNSCEFASCPCCGNEVSDDTREDEEYERRAIEYLREED
jgi:hypothetical protein